jgi:hypothetical protein
MRIKAIAFVPFSLAVVFAVTGCSSTETTDQPDKKPTKSKTETVKVKTVKQVDLTGLWTRSDKVEFDCIDSGELLMLKRRLTEKDEALKSFQVELSRKGKTLKGKARFFFVDEKDEYSLGWTMSSAGDYEYKATVESYEVDKAGKEVRKDLKYIFKIKPKYPPKPKVIPKAKPKVSPKAKPKVSPKAKPKVSPKAAGKSLLIKDTEISESGIKSSLRRIFSNDKKRSEEASLKLLNASRKADTLLENACFDQEDANKRMKLSLVLSFRKNSVGLESLLELRGDGNLNLATSRFVERFLNISLCTLFEIEGADISEANLKKVLLNAEEGAEASALAAKGKSFKPELIAVTWLKSDDLNSRKIAQAMLLPNGEALSGKYGEFEGAIYAAEDDKAQRDAAADDFIKWFEAGPKAKIEKK